MAMKTSVLLWAAVWTAAVAQANPLGFAEWTQTVEASFASSADAAKAELRCLDLPKGMTRAFGCRWDNANALHAAKGEMMTRAGVKGTFFLNGGNPKFYADVAPKLVAAGHAIGNHGLSHAFMQELPPNRVPGRRSSSSASSSRRASTCRSSRMPRPSAGRSRLIRSARS